MKRVSKSSKDLPIIQKTYDLIVWYIPHLNRLPRDHRFMLGDRIIAGLYDLLRELILARYEKEKLPRLESINGQLDQLRYQTRLLRDFDLLLKPTCLVHTGPFRSSNQRDAPSLPRPTATGSCTMPCAT